MINAIQLSKFREQRKKLSIKNAIRNENVTPKDSWDAITHFLYHIGKIYYFLRILLPVICEILLAQQDSLKKLAEDDVDELLILSLLLNKKS